MGMEDCAPGTCWLCWHELWVNSSLASTLPAMPIVPFPHSSVTGDPPRSLPFSFYGLIHPSSCLLPHFSAFGLIRDSVLPHHSTALSLIQSRIQLSSTVLPAYIYSLLPVLLYCGIPWH